MQVHEMAKLLDLNLSERRLGYHLTNNPNRLMPDGVKSITIHQTDNTDFGATAEAHHSLQRNNTSGVSASWHYTVDEDIAIQSFRDDRALYHSATKDGNYSSIGIEMCVDADSKGDSLKGKSNYARTLDNTQKLVACLLEYHGLTSKDIKQHYDWSGKNCPSFIRANTYGFDWKGFVASCDYYHRRLKELIAKPEKPVEPVKNVPDRDPVVTEPKEETPAVTEKPTEKVFQDPVNGPFFDGETKTRLWFRAVGGSFATRREAEKEIENMKKAGVKSPWLQAVMLKEDK